MGKGALLVVLIVVVVTGACTPLDGDPPTAGPVCLRIAWRIARAQQGRPVVVYVRGTPAEIDEQVDECAALCARRGYTVIAVVREQPGGTEGLATAHRMVRRGEADEIVVASGLILPDMFESASGSFPGRWARYRGNGRHRQMHRRTRPTRRGGAGA